MNKAGSETLAQEDWWHAFDVYCNELVRCCPNLRRDTRGCGNNSVWKQVETICACIALVFPRLSVVKLAKTPKEEKEDSLPVHHLLCEPWAWVVDYVGTKLKPAEKEGFKMTKDVLDILKSKLIKSIIVTAVYKAPSDSKGKVMRVT